MFNSYPFSVNTSVEVLILEQACMGMVLLGGSSSTKMPPPHIQGQGLGQHFCLAEDVVISMASFQPMLWHVHC